MLENLRKSFYTLEGDFHSWIRLANNKNNPHRRSDLLEAARIAGKLEQTGRILAKEYNDPNFKKTAAELWQQVQNIAETI